MSPFAACETCEHYVDEEEDGETVIRFDRVGTEVRKVCAEGPIHVRTTPGHRCGRWRIAERLCDGKDARSAA